MKKSEQCPRKPDPVCAVPGQMAALLAQLDGVLDRADAHDPLVWDGAGLPK